MSVSQITKRIVITIFTFMITNIGILFSNENSKVLIPNLRENQNANSVIIKKLISKKFDFINVNDNQVFSFYTYPNPINQNSLNVVFTNMPSEPINYKLVDLFTNKTIEIDQRYIQENRIYLQNISKGKYILTILLKNGDIHSQNIEIIK